MSELNSQQQVNEGLEAAKTGTELGAKAGKKTAEMGYKAGKWLARGGAKKIAAGGKAAGGFIAANPYIALGLIIVLLVLLVLSPVQGQISSTYRDTDRKTAINEKSNYNYPESAEEEEESINNKELAIENTLKLASIIHESKQEDYDRVKQYAQSHVETAAKRAARDGKDVDIDLSVRMASTEFTERSHLLWEGSQISSNVSGNAGEMAVAWARERAAESERGKWHYVFFGSHGIGKNGIKKSTDCPLCKPKTASQGWQCIGFVTAAYFHGAGVPSDIHRSTKYCHLGGLGNGGDGTRSGSLADPSCDPEKIYKKWVAQNGDGWIMAAHTKTTKSGCLSADQLEPGDVLLCYFSNGGCYHMAMYMGDNQYVDCSRSHGKKGGIRISTYGHRPTVRIAMRYTGPAGKSASRLSGSNSKNASDVINGACAWAEAIAADDSFHYGIVPNARHNGCYFCGTNKANVKKDVLDYKKSYICTSFVTAAFAHGGGEPAMLKVCRRGSSFGFGTKKANTYHQSPLFKNLGKPEFSSLKKGDVLCREDHVALYLGNNKLVEAGGGGDDNRRNSKRWNNSIRVKTIRSWGKYDRAYRYIGSGGGLMEIPGVVSTASKKTSATAVSSGAVSGWNGKSSDGKVYLGEAADSSDSAQAHSGDQSNEVRISKAGGSWDYVFRWKDANKSLQASKIMYDACKNQHVGYNRKSKESSTSFYAELVNAGGDASSISNNCDTACSQMVAAICVYLGADFPNRMDENKRYRTWVDAAKLAKVLKKSKDFQTLTDSAYTKHTDKLQPGDILVKANMGHGKHAAMVVKTASGLTGVSISGSSASGAAAMQPQKYRTVLKNIRSSAGTRKYLSNSGNTAQSFAYGNGKFYVQRISPGRYGHGGFVESYDRSVNHLKSGPHISQLGHGNGMEYKDGTLYSIWAGANRDKRTVQLIDPGTLKYAGKKNTNNAASGIGYDKDTDCWALNQRNSIVIYDGALNERKRTITKKGSHGADYVQDCMAAGGIVYSVIHLSGKNFIDLYRESDGAYLGSYTADGAELEGLTLTENNELVLLFHSAGTREYIQFTGITIETGGEEEGTSLSDYISAHDMDILAAYNISIANAATFMKAKENTTKSPLDTWLNKNAYYTDLSDKKVKIYWEDKKRGLIDYEKDLRKKADAWFKGFIDVSTVTADSSASTSSGSSSSSAWNLMLVNPAHAMPDDYSPGLTNINEKYLTNNDKWRNRIDTRVYDSLVKMMDDCKEAVGSKHAPLICSAFRTREMQQELYDSTANKDDTAVPGHSEHECGLAVDIVDKTYQTLDDAQADTKAQKWLMSHCQDYGFILRYPKGKQDITGIIWEPWHYRYVGKKDAKEIMSKGLTLEEYLGDTGASEESSGASSAPTPSEEEMSSDKHFFKVVLGNTPEKVGGSYIIPVTIKEKEVNELMDPLFGVKPNDVYVNSQSETQAKAKEKEDQTSALTSSNLDAVYSLSDSTGFTVFETQIYSQNIGFNTEADGALGIQAIGSAQQKAIINHIMKTWPLNGRNPYTNGYHGLCLKWVVDMYNGAGFSACQGQSVCCASKHRDLFAHKDRNIPPGAMIYSGSKYRSSCTCECGRNAGHVAIYLGNNKVAGSQSPYVMSLDQWTGIFGYGGWSFGGNKF